MTVDHGSLKLQKVKLQIRGTTLVSVAKNVFLTSPFSFTLFLRTVNLNYLVLYSVLVAGLILSSFEPESLTLLRDWNLYLLSAVFSGRKSDFKIVHRLEPNYRCQSHLKID